MAEDKYTWDDVIIDPTLEEAKNAVGKECYFADNPTYCVSKANSDASSYVLRSVEAYNIHPFVNMDLDAYGCIIIKKEKSYEDRVKQWVEDNNLKVGDYVKVTRKAENLEDGWKAYWSDEMDDWVGETLRVAAVNTDEYGILVENYYRFPYFVLEKVEEPKPKYVPFESLQEFISAYSKAHKEAMPDTESMLSSFGMWLKGGEHYELVTYIHNNGIIIDDISINWKTLFDYYTFLNGSPCGKLAEDNND